MLRSTKNSSLGNGFNVSEYSAKEVEIMYCFDRCCNKGLSVIPQKLLHTTLMENELLLNQIQATNNNQNNFSYGICRKGIAADQKNIQDSIKAHLIGPLDSATFYKTLSDKNIQLTLIKY